MGNTYKDQNIYFGRFSKECVYPSDYSSEPHTHEVCELLFLKKGTPGYFVEGKNYKLGKNSLVISRAGDRHKIYFDEPSPYSRYNILFDEKNIPFDLFTKIPSKLDIINFDGNTIVSDLFKRADYYFDHFEGEKLGKLLVGITEELFYNISIAIDENAVADCESASSNPVIAAALAFIDENLTSNLSIDTICEQLYITKSHLHHLFTNHLQISPKKYILSKRLNLAKRAIRTGLKPIEACMQSGFSDYSTFYRDYKKIFGHSPSRELDFEPDMGNADFYSSL
ncbi:MAG: helix-turn-helix transcriptional regulator [Clostridia bacterium]|nr:helix-turn-helix transcriptional regulator [Clostridia bacterium]